MYGGQQIPGRVQITGTKGVYVSFAGDRFLEDAEFLVVPNGCECKWIPANADARSRDGLVFVNDPSDFNFIVGRKNLTNNFQAISKVQYSTMWQWYTHQWGFEANDAASEVLVCEASTLPEKPTISFPTKACGELENFF